MQADKEKVQEILASIMFSFEIASLVPSSCLQVIDVATVGIAIVRIPTVTVKRMVTWAIPLSADPAFPYENDAPHAATE